MPVISCVEGLRVLAQKPVPRMFCDYVDDGSWPKSTCRANSNYFQKITLGQRQAITMARHSTTTDMFGPPMRMAVARVPTRCLTPCRTTTRPRSWLWQGRPPE
ncbi:MAG: alpha-hydroxy-acid oxidizing protein [Rhodoferax sp.]|nr:alpha-hydroxy-acid oxidizing protein [Rhodoferax sp.]